MKAYINHHLFTQTGVDSGSLTMHGAVVRNFPVPGQYSGTVFRGTRTVGHFQLSVQKDSPAMQVNIDLASLSPTASEGCGCKSMCHEKGRLFEASPKGYVVFHVSRGAGGYAVHVGPMEAEHKAASFDSRELKEGDLFAATLIRPGTYSVMNINTKARGEIVVAYPAPGKELHRPPEAVSIECTENALKPSKVRIEAAQGQVYRFKVRSRIKIELVTPDDGAGGARPSRIPGWKKPAVAGGQAGK